MFSVTMLIYFLALALARATPLFQPLGVPFKSPVTVSSGFSASVIFSNLTTPRGITIDSSQNILVIERGFGITAFSPTSTPSAGWERTVVLQNANLTQGIQVDSDKLYVSSAGDVLLYEYDAVTKSIPNTVPVILITGLPADGELTTHTLQLEKATTSILVGSGPLTNIDPTAREPSSGRSQVRRFPLAPAGSTWLDGELIAYGIRNPAGFAFDPSTQTSLYIVENGASIDNVTGLTPQFVNDNPADEINLVHLSQEGLGKFFGFPDCTTLWNPQADPEGDPQYVDLEKGAQISLHLEADRDDEWCQNETNNEPPVVSFQAHSVPLDIKFYKGTQVPSSGSFPAQFKHQAFVSFHGSFDRDPPTGYGVVRVPSPIGSSQDYEFVVQASNLTTCPGTCIRPVGLVFSKSGRLFVTSDSSGELFVIEAS